MYGIAELIEYPNSEDPKLQRIGLFDSLEEAINRTNSLIDVFFEEFGGDYCLEATEKICLPLQPMMKLYREHISQKLKNKSKPPIQFNQNNPQKINRCCLFFY